jgi:hypothetical protein
LDLTKTAIYHTWTTALSTFYLHITTRRQAKSSSWWIHMHLKCCPKGGRLVYKKVHVAL